MIGKIIKNKKGFGLLEIAVSISVIMISVIPIVNILTSSLRDEIDIEARLNAVYLAQDGMEIMRKIRDDDANFPLTDALLEGDKVIVVINSSNYGQCKNAKITDGFELKDKTAQSMQVLTKEINGYIQCEYDTEITSSGEWHNSGFQRYVNISYPAVGVMKATVKVERGGKELYSLTSYLNDLR
ncbi:MAG: hypothetical protein WC788_02440 [Candidatus Paceibacterota bacterium]|jgi:hypothetical protein